VEIARSLLSSVFSDLSDWGQRGTESIAFLLGNRNESRASVTAVVLAEEPGVERDPFHLRLTEDWMLQLAICAEERDEIVVGHFHSHGMEAFLSDVDEHHIFHAPGCFSFVVPDFALTPASKNPERWAAYVGVAEGRFAQISAVDLVHVTDGDGVVIVVNEAGNRYAGT
jgi:proteasome lid subunit RPN8/RPN11